MNAISTMLKMSTVLAMTFCCFGASAAVNYVADPDPAVMVSELSSVTLTFPDVDRAVDFGSQYQNVTITSEDYSKKCTLEYGDEDNQMVVNFDKITAEGKYTINFPAGAIDADSTPLEAFYVIYTIGKEEVKNATLIPAPGEVEWLYEFTFSDPNITANLSINSQSAEMPYVKSPSGEVSELSAVYDYQIGPGKYRFRMRKLATELGTYTINFPENYISYQDADYKNVFLPAYEFKYEVKGGELTEVVSDPSMTEPTHNFNYLYLEFPGYSTVAVKDGLSYTDSSIPVYIEGKEGALTSLLITNFKAKGNKLIFDNQYSDYITPGDYFLTVPAGCIELGEEKTPCTPFLVNFKVTAPDPVKIDIVPADGATVSMLRSAVITFPEISKVELARSPSLALYKITTEGEEEKTTTIGTAGSSSITRLTDNSFVATFNGLATTDGDYRIFMEENSFTFETGYNQKYSVNVKFTAPAAPEFTMTPDNAEALPKLQKFTITFPKESVVKLNTSLYNKNTTLYKGAELEYNQYGSLTNPSVGSTNGYTAVEGTTNSFSFTLSAAGLDEGKYLLTIPAGVFLMGEDEDNFNRAISVVYECNGEGFDKIEVTPSRPVKELKNMSIKFIDETSISFQTSYPGMTLFKYLEGQTYGQYLEYLSGDALKIEGNTLFISMANPITDAGKYYVEITQYLLKMSDGETTSTPQKVYFEVDPNADPVSVRTIDSDKTDSRIFTITGLEAKDMKAPGIYVVNGKKVIVK